MKHSRLLFAFIAAGCAGSSFAQYTSPELMLVTDAGGTTPAGTTAPAQIERYDPYTGAYLGAFGAGYVTDPFGVTVIGADAYVTDSFTVGTTPYSRIDKFNFSTGAYDGTIFSSSPDFLTGVTTYGSYLLASDFGSGGLNGGIYTYNSSGAQTNFYGMPQNSEPLSIATDASHVYVSSYQGLYSYNLNSSGVPTGLVFNASASSILFGVLYDGAKNSVYASGYSTINEYNTSGSIVSTYSNSAYGLDNIAFGHNGILYGLEGFGDQIVRFDSNEALNFGPLGTFKLNYSGNPQRIAVYAAPEPFSMAGLAFGVAGVLLRRRAKRAPSRD